MNPSCPQPEADTKLSGQASFDVIQEGVSVLQLNVEGLTKAKINVIEQLLQTHKATVVLLQETHAKDSSYLKIPGFTLAAHTVSEIHGIATFVKSTHSWKALVSCPSDSPVEWTATLVEEVTIINIYKPPSFRLQPNTLPIFSAPCIYAGDFNSHSTSWGYSSTNPDGFALEDWSSTAGVQLLFDPKQPDSFHSCRWNTTSNPDLAFVNFQGPSPHRIILDPFPKSQHRPSLLIPVNPVRPVTTKPVKRWNFRKADWKKFSNLVDEAVCNLPPPTPRGTDQAYSDFCNILIKAATNSIPRGFRRHYIPTWDEECDAIYNQFLRSEPGDLASTKASELTDCLDRKRRKRWEETVQGIDFTHSSRVAWKTLKRLTGNSTKPRTCPVSANSIAEQLVSNGRFKDCDKAHTRSVKQETTNLWQAPGVDGWLSAPFSQEELANALALLRSGKAQGPDNIPPEFLIHCGVKCQKWLTDFYSCCFTNQVIPKIWRKATVIALPKPNKPVDDPKSYRPISLLCVPYKLLERLLLARIEPVVDPQLPDEQAGFRHGRSTVHQIVKLTNDIEDSFEKNHKAGAIFVDLTAAYDTVWHQGLTLKLLKTIPDRHMVRFLCNILANRRFVLKTSDGQSSRPRQLRNGVPQGSVLSPLLFNIYISDIPFTTSRQYGYADDLALLHSDRAWSNVENTLTADMSQIAKYFRIWRLKISMSKTTVTAFHLNTKEANRQLSVILDGTPLPYNATPTYLGVKLDRQLTYKEQLKAISAKVSSRNNLLHRLAGSKWGASATTLRTSALALVYSAAEYASPAWCRSSHTKKLDSVLNDTMRLITGCLRPTPTEFLPVLSGIAPAPMRREHHTHRLVTKASSNPDDLLHDVVEGSVTLGQRHQRLKSRRPFSRHAATLRGSDFNICQTWRTSWEDTQRPAQLVVTPNTSVPPGANLPRSEWVSLNRIRTGVGRFNAAMHRWGLRPSAACQCGAPEQTAQHILSECPDLRPPDNMDPTHPTPQTVTWLQQLRDII